LSQRSETITFDIAITTDIEESVRDVFRQHRIDVTLKSLSPGRLVVRTKTADIDSLESAEAAALADVYGLAEINVVNEKPFPKTPVINNRTLVSMPGQEIRLIMVGNPSYVVTEDQSHFFAGSKLPTGHRIKSIEKDKVILDKQGEITELLM